MPQKNYKKEREKLETELSKARGRLRTKEDDAREEYIKVTDLQGQLKLISQWEKE